MLCEEADGIAYTTKPVIFSHHWACQQRFVFFPSLNILTISLKLLCAKEAGMRNLVINYSLLSPLPTAPLLSNNCTRQTLPGVCGNETMAINSKCRHQKQTSTNYPRDHDNFSFIHIIGEEGAIRPQSIHGKPIHGVFQMRHEQRWLAIDFLVIAILVFLCGLQSKYCCVWLYQALMSPG